MKLGIIYAGQGSQVVGMGKSFYPREIFDQNEDLKELCFNGPLEKLSHPIEFIWSDIIFPSLQL